MGIGLKTSTIFAGVVLAFGLASPAFSANRQMENLSRGLAVTNTGKGMLVSWRLLGTDAPDVEFNLYRDGEKIASVGKTGGTNYLDAAGKTTSKYTVAAVVGGKEGAKQGVSVVLDKTVSNSGKSFPYKTIKLEVPAAQTMPDGEKCTYTPNDVSTADLDGDGEYELILKWDPSNAHDNSQTGYTGTVFIDAYKLDGTRLWRIDLGKNIRAGAHYTQFQVFDYDGDGKAEMIVKTADGTIDGTGKAIGDKSKDYRSSAGTILDGPEYLTVFRGVDGAAISTVTYEPSRNILSHSSPQAKGKWGDNYGNRCERYLAATGYLDGVHPSAIFVRGYYSSAYVAAYDFDGKDLKLRWLHKSEDPDKGLYGEGNHSLQAADLDGDGYDEVFFGAAALNHDGTLRYRTGLGHGDAHHIGDLDPDLPGLESWDVHEHKNAQYTEEMRANDGKIIWGTPQPSAEGVDNGRGMAADVDSEHRGYEMWSAKGGGMKTAKGKLIGTPAVSQNFRIYFDGDEYDELMDGAFVTKFNSTSKKSETYFDGPSALGVTGCNGTKNTPSLVADLFGDWREEMVVRSEKDPTLLYIVSTPVTSEHRVYTLMHDATYRTAVASQNTAYNQPPHLGYYLPDMVKSLKQPSIFVVGEDPAPADTTPVVNNGKSELDASTPKDGKGVTETTNEGFLKNGYYNFDNALSSYGTWEIFSKTEAKTTLTVRFTNGGTTSRNMAVNVNGASAGTLSFASTGDWTKYSEAKVDVKLVAGVNTITFTSMTSDGGPNVDMFTFGIDGVELYDGTQKIDNPTALAVIPFKNGVSFNPSTGVLFTPKAGFAEVYFYDMSGAMRMGVSRNVNSGLTTLSLDREMLPKGTYLVKVMLDGKAVSTKKFSKL
ncbi:Por secretion system C-terminal sorting domain-containing protein [Fibrobacter sp. UWB15]|uniref:rhamnogalacturonan lyase family protein n=1 Tax=unclassified Fibrobacter TaxID=2634177 RepID=UPI0009166571|nr:MULTISPECIES: carbohydrate-binding protein [unclassified Fibrobacter]PWJ65828.1 putative secreted protein (Por secretion system target) [Fibrobacter sp. UWB6]SHF92363.1 Por secretion system C-terminal sorting domain-containing protein [Fibrobacter sp. UWB8]SMG26208.1 Por secretion system C-terminal sorting domain-containing protein [Fibrobacter sp. UWB15]